MVPEDLVTQESPPDPVTEDQVATVPSSGQPATDTADSDAEQARKWFEEDDAASEPAAPAENAEPAPEEPAEPAAKTDTSAAPEKPAAEPAPAKPSPAPVDALPSAFDYDAVMQKAIASIPSKLKVGDKDVDVGAFVADFPEAPAIMASVASHIVQQVVGPMLPVFQAIQEQQFRNAFLEQVEAKVPDVRQVASSQEFRAWVDQQPKPLQKMARSDDVESAVFVLNQYAATKKPAAPTKPTARPSAPTNPAFERRKAALAGILGGKVAARSASGPDKNDYRAAFEEDDD